MALTDKLTAIADAIRAKGGTTGTMTLAEMPEKIAAIQTGGAGGDDSVVSSIIGRSITEILDNNVTSIGIYAFNSCKALTTVNLPAATSIGPYAFQSCTALTSVDFPAATSIGTYTFDRCSALKTADFQAAMEIRTYAFSNCLVLYSLILRSETMATLYNTNAFNSTPIKSGSGYIYVPAALVDSYKTATNWSVYADQIRAIEDYPDITGGAA